MDLVLISALLTCLTFASIGVAPASADINSVTVTPPGSIQVVNKGPILVLPNSSVEFTCECAEGQMQMHDCNSPQWNHSSIDAQTKRPAVLVVFNLQRKDLQHIRCVDPVLGNASPKQSAVVFRDELWLLLNVSSPASEIKPRKDKLDVSVGVNEAINLTCVVQPAEASRLLVNVSWSYQEAKLSYPNVVEGSGLKADAQPFTVSSATAAAHTLVFEAIERKYRGEYTCAATIAGVGSIRFGDDKPSKVLIRVKDRLSALWPFLGIVAEVLILTTIILIYERRRAAREAAAADEEDEEVKPMAAAAEAARGAQDAQDAQEMRQRAANA